MNKTKKRILIAVLCVVVLVLCSYYLYTRQKEKEKAEKEAETQTQTQIVALVYNSFQTIKYLSLTKNTRKTSCFLMLTIFLL